MVGGRTGVKLLVKRITRRERGASQQQQGEQTGKSRFGNATERELCKFPLQRWKGTTSVPP